MNRLVKPKPRMLELKIRQKQLKSFSLSRIEKKSGILWRRTIRDHHSVEIEQLVIRGDEST